MEEKFKIRSYGFGELAQMYFPQITKQSATVQFGKWIRLNENLKIELKAAGYKRWQKIFTPKQVEILVKVFGEP